MCNFIIEVSRFAWGIEIVRVFRDREVFITMASVKICLVVH